MKETERNPFHEMSLTELADACRGLKQNLKERRHRNHEERAELVLRATSLLAAVADRLEPHFFMPHCPEYYLAKGRKDIAGEFIEWHRVEMERAQHAVRNRTLSRMAHLVLGTKAALWINPHVGGLDERPLYKATESDDGLCECLRELETLALTHVT